QDTLWQALVARDFGPGVAAVGRLEQAAARATAGEAPRVATRLPEGRVQHARIVWIHAQVAGAGVGGSEQDVLPGRTPVTRTEDAPLLVGAMRVAQGGHVHDIRVGGMHAHFGD